MRAVSDRHFATNRDLSEDRTFLFLEKGPNPYKKQSTETENRVEVLVSSDIAPNIRNSKLSQKSGTSARTEFFFVENGPNP